ncbi:hypothetical protein F383_39002 [Gossypium arboreum]|nr:hypothetical protein F383_39002 [Gossypium arboreum]
MFILRRA